MFWRRQFDSERTAGKILFDVMFGVVLPVACLLTDPFVFRQKVVTSDGLLGPYRTACHFFIALEILLLVAWLVLERRLSLSSGKFAGAFFAGALFCFALGGAILAHGLGRAHSRIALIFSLVVFGLLGLAPCLAGFVFLRNGVRAFLRMCEASSRARAWSAAVVAALLLGAFVPAIHSGFGVPDEGVRTDRSARR